MERKVGLLVGREWSFPPAFIEEVNSRQTGVVAEYGRSTSHGWARRVNTT